VLEPWTPDLESLDLLVSVAELGSLGKAAAAHGITQPSASVRLSRLERRLGVSLLVRTPRGTRLTPTGETVVTWAQDVLDRARALTDSVTSLRAETDGVIKVSASLTIAEYLLPAWLMTVRRDQPPLQAAVTVTNSQHVFDDVQHGNADLGLVESPTVPEGLSSELLGYDHLALVASPHHEAAHASAPYAVKDLVDLPLLLREHGSGTRDTFTRAVGMIVGQSAVVFPHSTELGSTTTQLATARAGGGIAVVSRRAAQADLDMGTLQEIPVGQISLRRGLHAVWKGRRASASARRLITVACEDLGATA